MIGNLHYMSLFQKEVELPYLCFTANTEGSEIGIQKTGSSNNELYYSFDGKTWIAYTAASTATKISLSQGQKIYWKCNAQEPYYSNKGAGNIISHKFVMTGSIAGSGNIMSLVDGVGETLVIPYQSMFRDLFSGCASLTTAPELPATTLADSCYYSMFNTCTSLTTLPELPATTLADSCYYRMFFRCAKIKLSRTQTGEYQTPYRIPKEGTGTTATSALYDMFTSTGGAFKSDPTINTTYYTSNTVV